MKKRALLSFFLILSLTLALALSVVNAIGGVFVSYDLCQESQSEEQESEEKENYNEVEDFVLGGGCSELFSGRATQFLVSQDPVYININQETATPPPRIG